MEGIVMIITDAVIDPLYTKYRQQFEGEETILVPFQDSLSQTTRQFIVRE